MSAERVRSLNEFARHRHPGLVGVEILSCEPELVTGRLDVTAPLVAGTGFLGAGGGEGEPAIPGSSPFRPPGAPERRLLAACAGFLVGAGLPG